MIFEAMFTGSWISDSSAGVGRVFSSRRCRATRIAAAISRTRLRPSIHRDGIPPRHLFAAPTRDVRSGGQAHLLQEGGVARIGLQAFQQRITLDLGEASIML